MRQFTEAAAVVLADRDRKKQEARLIRNGIASGSPVKEIAEIIGVTERHVENVRDALRLVGEL